MKQKKTLQILLLVFAGLIVLYTGVNLYQKQQSSKEDSDQTKISDLKSLTSISYNPVRNAMTDARNTCHTIR